MQRSRRPLAASVFALCSLVLMVVLFACSPAAAKKSAEQAAAKGAVPVAEALEADVPITATMLAANLAGDAPAMPTPPKVSTFAPADDLVRQADLYIAGLEKSVAD
ncbi:MAG: hypothetical protein LLG00_03925, partial [Planctomycetaceae bacterium]|nr:hypothetical protein [Planctomycetaceae bacterium]